MGIGSPSIVVRTATARACRPSRAALTRHELTRRCADVTGVFLFQYVPQLGYDAGVARELADEASSRTRTVAPAISTAPRRASVANVMPRLRRRARSRHMLEL